MGRCGESEISQASKRLQRGFEPRARDYKEKHKLDSKLISDSAFGAHLSFCQK